MIQMSFEEGERSGLIRYVGPKETGEMLPPFFISGLGEAGNKIACFD